MARRAYADSPYWGVCARYDHFHPDGRCWDDGETHRLLIERLNRDFPDGWALSCKADAGELSQLVQWAELGGKVRVSPWVKPFASFKPGVNPGHCWEAVIWRTNAKRDRYEPTVRDFLSCNITMGKGLVGAKPPEFNRWVIDLLGMKPTDELVGPVPRNGQHGLGLARLQPAGLLERGLLGPPPRGGLCRPAIQPGQRGRPMTDKPVLVCSWDPYHQNHLPDHGILVCAECERPVLAIELRGSPAVSDAYEPLPMGSGSWTTWDQHAAQSDKETRP